MGEYIHDGSGIGPRVKLRVAKELQPVRLEGREVAHARTRAAVQAGHHFLRHHGTAGDNQHRTALANEQFAPTGLLVGILIVIGCVNGRGKKFL